MEMVMGRRKGIWDIGKLIINVRFEISEIEKKRFQVLFPLIFIFSPYPFEIEIGEFDPILV
jgi:hypothetical protein